MNDFNYYLSLACPPPEFPRRSNYSETEILLYLEYFSHPRIKMRNSYEQGN